MRKELIPGEQVITITRKQARSLFFPVLVFIAVPAAAGFACAWIVRENPQRLAPFITAAWTPWLLGTVILLAVWSLAAYSFKRVLRWRSVKYILTSRRVLARNGMFRRNDWQVSLVAIRNVGVRQSMLQRTLRSGNISLDTGHSGVAVLADVPEVARFRGFILDAMDELPQGEVFEGEVLKDFEELPWELKEGGRDER